MSSTVEQEMDDDDNFNVEPSPAGSSRNTLQGKMKVCNHFVYEFRSS